MTTQTNNIKNASDLEIFNPVEGEWFVNGTSDERDHDEVVEAITAHFAHQFPVKVEIFQASGRAITGDLPGSGTFLATRK